MLYDTHCHPYLAEKKSQETILNNFSESWVFLNCIWIDIESSHTSITLSQKYPYIFATVWVHPSYAKNYIKNNIFDTMKILEELYLANKEKVVAIWECGLDYFYLWSTSWNTEIILSSEEEKTIQKLFFIEHITLAKKYNLPLIIHNRNAKDDVLNILIQENYHNFVMHCFCENLDFAKKCIAFAPECKISFSGIITFNSAHDIQETAQKIPLKNIIIETDSPYLTPVPFRGKEENEPLFVQYVLDKIIELREESPEIIQEQIFHNSREIFWI